MNIFSALSSAEHSRENALSSPLQLFHEIIATKYMNIFSWEIALSSPLGKGEGRAPLLCTLPIIS